MERRNLNKSFDYIKIHSHGKSTPKFKPFQVRVVRNTRKQLIKSFIKSEFEQQIEKLVKLSTFIENSEQTISSFFNSKINGYKKMCDKIIQSFENLIIGLEKQHKSWIRKINEFKERLKNEENRMNSHKKAFENNSEGSEKNSMDSSENDSEISQIVEQKLQQIEYNSLCFMDEFNKSKSAINSEEKNLCEKCDKLFIHDEILIPEISVENECINFQIAIKNDKIKPNDIYFLNLQSMCYEKIKIPTQKIHYNSAGILVKNRYFLCGGNDQTAKIEYSEMYELDKESASWIKKQSMNIARRNHTLISFNSAEFIYAICGYNSEYKYLSHCEKYSINHNKWIEIPETNEKKQDPSICQVNNRFIYIMGGGKYEDSEWIFSDNIEYLDTYAETEWKIFNLSPNSDILPPQCYCGAVQVSYTEILIFGGFHDNLHQNECFILNLENSTLEKLSTKLPKPASFINRNSLPKIKGNLLYAIQANSLDIFVCGLSEFKWRFISKEIKK